MQHAYVKRRYLSECRCHFADVIIILVIRNCVQLTLPVREGKGKGVPLQARCGPESYRRIRLPDFHDIRHLKVVRSSPSRTGRLYPQECSWYSFSLGAESTPGPWYARKEICHWEIQWHRGESIPIAPAFDTKLSSCWSATKRHNWNTNKGDRSGWTVQL
jgi:hypothetical protein